MTIQSEIDMVVAYIKNQCGTSSKGSKHEALSTVYIPRMGICEVNFLSPSLDLWEWAFHLECVSSPLSQMGDPGCGSSSVQMQQQTG